jgi:hypothetical protein
MMRPLVFDVNGPANPGALTAAPFSGGIQLNWATYSQGTGTQATNLVIQRAPAGGSFSDLTGATALSVSTTSYQDTSTAAQTGSWSYRIVAYNGSTLSGPSNLHACDAVLELVTRIDVGVPQGRGRLDAEVK